MGTILQLSKSLLPPVENVRVPGVEVRHFRGPTDIRQWIELRNRAFARETVGVRQWDEADFRREMLDKPWWSDDRFWFAIKTTDAIPAMTSSGVSQPSTNERVVGAVVLADRGAAEQAQAAIHWLIVLPGWRRKGVGRLLISALEARAWELGHRHVVLETHAAWRSAALFYERLGYQPTRHTDK
jgi:GNAT superfamily N-acetyltransferase